MRSFSLLPLATVFFLWPAFALGRSQTPLKDYLDKALPQQESPALNPDDRTLLFRDVELRVGADEEYLKSARFRVSPFAWSERAHQRELTKIEYELFSAQALENSSGRSYQIGKLVISLAALEKKLALLQDMKATCLRVIDSYERNMPLLAEKPEDYVKQLQERLEAEAAIQETENGVKHTRSELAKAAGMPVDDFSLNWNDLISLDELGQRVQNWEYTPDSPELRTKALLATKAQLETEIETNKTGFVLNYFDVGASLKEDGSADKLEWGLGISLPIFSGEYKAREFELESKKLNTANDVTLSRLEQEQVAETLKNQIQFRVNHYRDEAIKLTETSMKRVQKQTNEQLGSGSMPALKIQLALEKLRIAQHEARSPAWEEFLDLAMLLGKLDPKGHLLLAQKP